MATPNLTPIEKKEHRRLQKMRSYRRRRHLHLPKMGAYGKQKHLSKIEEMAGEKRPSVCEVCGRSGGRWSICLDHDHATGIIRGWLCGSCNRALGYVSDNPQLLRQLASYLEHPRIGRLWTGPNEPRAKRLPLFDKLAA